MAEYAAKGLKQAAKVVRRGIEIFASSSRVKNLASSTKHFAQWARQMVNEFGQNVKKHLRDLYKSIIDFNKRLGRRGSISFKDVDKKTLRDSNVPVSDEAFELLGIPKNRIVANYEFLQKRHPEYFNDTEDVRKIVEAVLDTPEFSTKEKDALVGLVKKGEGTGKFKNPKVKIRIAKRPDGYHIRSVHLLSDEQYNANKERAWRRSENGIASKPLISGFTPKGDSPQSVPKPSSYNPSIPKNEVEVKLSEIDEIKAQAKADGTWLKAPNGKASKLNERQWLQVRTKAFKDWFGDWQHDPDNASKVVDENGEPMVVYHGTARLFTEFSKQKAQDIEGRKRGFGWGKGKFYFANNANAAQSSADFAVATKRGTAPTVMHVYLSAKKVIHADDYMSMVNRHMASGKSRDAAISVVDKEMARHKIEGIISDVGGYAVFNANQIKSATANIGSFSKSNSNILYSVEYLVAKYTAKVFNAGWRLFKVTAGNFAKWARVMVAELGNSIKPKLRGLYKDLREFSMFNARNARRGAISFKDVDKKPEPVVLKSVSEMTDEDFINPSRSILLPSLPDNTLKIIGSEKKPVLIKQNILEKNKLNHKELTAEDSRKILNTALYSPDLIGRGKAQTKPSYWVAVKLGSKNAVVVIDITETKGNHEIVGWRMIDEKGLANMKKQAEREDGQFLITKSENTQGAADRLSALPPDLSTPSIPKTETEVKPADKKTRLVKPKDFQWEKIDKDTYLLQFTDPDNGNIETVAKLVRNKTGKGSHKWNWAGTNRGFLDAVSAKSVVKSNVFERVKRSKHEQRKAKRIAAREMAKEEKKLEKAQEYIKAGEKKAEAEAALPKTLKEKINYFLERGEIMFFDIWAPVRRLQEKIEGEKGEKLSDDLNLYQKLELISGKIEENIKETKAKYFDPIIKILKENKIEVKDFNRFLYVSHAEERNNAIAKRPDNPFALTGEPGSGITTEQANKELKKYEALPNYEAYVKAAALSYELNNFLLDEQVRLGMMTEKQRIAYGKYQKYTPLKSPPDQGFILDKQALGRRSEASEQLAYIEQAIHATYSRAYKKDIAGTAIKLFSLFPNKEMYEQVKPQMVQYLDKKGNARIKQAMDKFFGNPEMIWVKDPSTGKYTVFRIKDKFLRDAVIGREKNDAIESKVFRGFAAVNRWLAGMATAYNPEFIYTNLFRDVQQGAAVVDVNLPEGSVKKFLGNLKRAKQAIADSRAGKVTEDTKLLKEFLLGGGMTGYSEFMKLENRAAAIEAEVSSSNQIES